MESVVSVSVLWHVEHLLNLLTMKHDSSFLFTWGVGCAWGKSWGENGNGNDVNNSQASLKLKFSHRYTTCLSTRAFFPASSLLAQVALLASNQDAIFFLCVPNCSIDTGICVWFACFSFYMIECLFRVCLVCRLFLKKKGGKGKKEWQHSILTFMELTLDCREESGWGMPVPTSPMHYLVMEHPHLYTLDCRFRLGKKSERVRQWLSGNFLPLPKADWKWHNMRMLDRNGLIILIRSSTFSNLQRHMSLQLLHFSYESLDERGLACTHLPHHCYQLPRFHTQVEAMEGRGRRRGRGGGSQELHPCVWWTTYSESVGSSCFSESQEKLASFTLTA